MSYIDLIDLFNNFDKKVLNIKLVTYTKEIRDNAKKHKLFNID